MSKVPVGRQRSQNLENVLESINCPICMTEMKVPKLLPCGHTLCKDCVSTISKKNKAGFDCPECRKPVKLGPGGVDGLPNNPTIMSIKDLKLEIAAEPKVTSLGSIKEASYCSFCVAPDDTMVAYDRHYQRLSIYSKKGIRRFASQNTQKYVSISYNAKADCYVATDESPILTLLDKKSLKPTKKIRLSGCRSCWDVVITANGDFASRTSVSSNQISFHDKDGGHIADIPNLYLFDDWCMNSKGQILTSTADGVRVYDLRGKQVNHFAESQAIAGVKVDAQDNIYVTFKENKKLQVLSNEGEVLTEKELPTTTGNIKVNDKGTVAVAGLGTHKIDTFKLE